MSKIFLLLKLVSILQLSSCFSYFYDSSNYGAKLTISELSSSYISNLISANFDAIENNLFISAYLENQKLSRDEYTKRVTQLKDKWPVDLHPLAHLTFVDSSINDSKGSVILQRLDKSKSFPKVIINFEWTGNSWSIIDDNILGKKDLFEIYK